MENIHKYISRIYRATQINRDDAFAELGLTGIQISYINLICLFPGTNQDDLAKWLFVNRSSVTRQVQQLMDLGYIDRKTSAEDKRAKHLYPTEKALSLHPRIRTRFEDWNNTLTSALSQAEQDTLIVLLKQLAKTASDHVAHPLSRLEEKERDSL